MGFGYRTRSHTLVLGAAFAFVVTLAAATPAQAQFRNQGVAPTVSWLGLNTWDLVINNGPPRQNLNNPAARPDPGWNLTDQPAIGITYFLALGYQLWFDNNASLGFWTTTLDVGSTKTPVMSLNVSTGLRYNFLEERHRPFVSLHLDYFQLFAFSSPDITAPIPGNTFLGNTPFFVGARPGLGYEWIFGDEASVWLEASIVGSLVPDPNRGLGGLFLPSSVVRAGYSIYF